MKINEIAFTGTPVTDMKRAREFYEDVLGLNPSSDCDPEASWVEYDIAGGTFGIGCYGDAWLPGTIGTGTCIAFEVEDFDTEIAALKSKNVKFAMDVMPTSVCQFAIICNPDDNQIMIHKRKTADEIANGQHA